VPVFVPTYLLKYFVFLTTNSCVGGILATIGGNSVSAACHV
jgi:hypothetical protein